MRIWATDELADPVVLRHERPGAAQSSSVRAASRCLPSTTPCSRWATDGRDEPLVLPHPGSTMIATFSPEGERVLTDSGDGLTRIWSIAVLLQHRNPVLSAFFSPKADRVVTVARDQTVRIWPLDRRSRSGAIQHHGDVLATAFSPDGAQIVTASRDGTAKIQAIDSSTEPVVLHHEAPVNLAAFSPDGTHVVTGAEDGLTRVWRSGAPAEPVVLGPPGSYKGHTEVNAVSFSPDGRRVLSASGPLVRIWPADGAEEPLVLMGRSFGGTSRECRGHGSHQRAGRSSRSAPPCVSGPQTAQATHRISRSWFDGSLRSQRRRPPLRTGLAVRRCSMGVLHRPDHRPCSSSLALAARQPSLR